MVDQGLGATGRITAPQLVGESSNRRANSKGKQGIGLSRDVKRKKKAVSSWLQDGEREGSSRARGGKKKLSVGAMKA